MDNLFESKRQTPEVENPKEEDLPFVDIVLVEEVDTRENFIIRCEDKAQMIALQNFFKTKAKKIEFERLCQIIKLSS